MTVTPQPIQNPEYAFKTLPDTDAIAEFMRTFGQPVYDVRQTDPPKATLLLRARLVLEEAFELVAALGLKVAFEDGEEPRVIAPKAVTVSVDPDATYDPIETVDALADLVVVVKGSGLQLGLPVDEVVLDEVCPSNMSKLGIDGEPIFDVGGKIMKGPGYFVPNVQRVLDRHPSNG